MRNHCTPGWKEIGMCKLCTAHARQAYEKPVPTLVLSCFTYRLLCRRDGQACIDTTTICTVRWSKTCVRCELFILKNEEEGNGRWNIMSWETAQGERSTYHRWRVVRIFISVPPKWEQISTVIPGAKVCSSLHPCCSEISKCHPHQHATGWSTHHMECCDGALLTAGWKHHSWATGKAWVSIVLLFSV